MRASQFLKRILRDNRGATAIEYGLILALICVSIIVTLQATAGEVSETWDVVDDSTTEAMDAAPVAAD